MYIVAWQVLNQPQVYQVLVHHHICGLFWCIMGCVGLTIQCAVMGLVEAVFQC